MATLELTLAAKCPVLISPRLIRLFDSLEIKYGAGGGGGGALGLTGVSHVRSPTVKFTV